MCIQQQFEAPECSKKTETIRLKQTNCVLKLKTKTTSNQTDMPTRHIRRLRYYNIVSDSRTFTLDIMQKKKNKNKNKQTSKRTKTNENKTRQHMECSVTT